MAVLHDGPKENVVLVCLLRQNDQLGKHAGALMHIAQRLLYGLRIAALGYRLLQIFSLQEAPKSSSETAQSGEARHLLELSRPDHDIHNHDKRVFMAITNEVRCLAPKTPKEIRPPLLGARRRTLV